MAASENYGGHYQNYRRSFYLYPLMEVRVRHCLDRRDLRSISAGDPNHGLGGLKGRGGLAGQTPVVGSATPIAGRGGRCGEARDMSLSDREPAEGFRGLYPRPTPLTRQCPESDYMVYPDSFYLPP